LNLPFSFRFNASWNKGFWLLKHIFKRKEFQNILQDFNCKILIQDINSPRMDGKKAAKVLYLFLSFVGHENQATKKENGYF
jgi:hypothetical protein